MAGTLFVVATPIGNLEDLTFRALRTLREVDLIAAEDTRRTAKLLAHYDIRKSLVSLREHNERREAPRLVARLLAGQSIALVSDAGTPAVADPGAGLVRLAHAEALRVVPIPGATAIAVALSAAGVPADQFVFLGFPPSSGTRRTDWFEELAQESRTAVFFEAPHRVQQTMDSLAAMLAVRPIFVFRELTKVNENLVKYTSSEHHNDIIAKGEFTIVVGPSGTPPNAGLLAQAAAPEALDLFGRLTDYGSFTREEATSLVASHLRLSVSAARKLIKKARILVKQQNKPAP
jgi:16S rRNA (cytidine1402-2'-O)-methyltransferase